MLSSYWLAHFNFMKKSAKVLKIVDSPAFLELSLAEKLAVCAHTTRLP
jgi:hypothetical protein